MVIITEKPDIEFGPLRIWVHGRQFPESEDYWDGNWLLATAHYNSIEATGAIITTDEIRSLMQDCQKVLQAGAGTIDLACTEPYIQLHLESDTLGHLNGKIEITPDPAKEVHEYRVEFDQSYLPNVIRQCESVLKQYPIKGNK
ncbi:MAG TPA: hypothetical protein VI957_02625 [Candidatus Paceibacterota bacterium]